MILLRGLLGSAGGWLTVASIAAVAAFGWLKIHDYKIESRVVAKMERNDNAAAVNINQAESVSRSATPGRLQHVSRDPNAAAE